MGALKLSLVQRKRLALELEAFVAPAADSAQEPSVRSARARAGCTSDKDKLFLRDEMTEDLPNFQTFPAMR